MKRILLIVALLMFTVSSAYAANFGLVQVTANVADGSEISIGGKTGDEKGPEVGFSGVGMATAEKAADYHTDVSYKTNLTSWKITVSNVTTDNATMVDGLMKYDDVTASLPLYVLVQDDTAHNTNINLSDAGWKQVQDSQRDGVEVVIANGNSVELSDIQKDIYWKADFSDAVPSGYYAIIQFQVSQQ